jgi:hypothetical protein
MVREGSEESRHGDPTSRSQPKGVSESGAVEAEASEKRPGIFVRINPLAKEALETAASGSLTETGSMTYAKVIERLLEYFGKQGPDLKRNILRGIHVNPLKDSEDMVARLHRAQHAFENGRYYYAVQTYEVIADSLKDSDSSEELLEVCHYRLGHCWIRLSYDLRVDALSALSSDLASDSPQEDRKAKCAKLFSGASEALDIALHYLAQVKADGDTLTKLISHYNKACCHSLKAQYMVESKLDSDSIGELRKAWEEKDVKKMQQIWKFIGDTWRKNDSDRRPDSQAEQALSNLERIYSINDNNSDHTRLSSGGNWLVEISSDDWDLFFIRSDETWKPKFNEWRTSALPGDKSVAKGVGVTDLLKSSKRRLGLPS